LAASALATALGATPYDGIYKQTANSDCGIIGVDGASVEIRDGIFYGVKTECNMTRPVNVVDMNATLYTMECTGEDSRWTERAMLMTAAEGDGIVMVWNGYVFKYERCTLPALTPVADAPTGSPADTTE
jgi:hypothetical protein